MKRILKPTEDSSMIVQRNADIYLSKVVNIPNETSDSLRRRMGVFYTPQSAADYMADWIVRDDNQWVLEPSFGDGIFLRAITKSALRNEFAQVKVYGVEIDRKSVDSASSQYLIEEKYAICKDFFSVNPSYTQKVEAIIGNPPYVRLRHLQDQAQRQRALKAAQSVLGYPMEPSGSLWMPFVLHAMRFLKKGGRLAFVLPYDFTYVRYARPLWDKLRNSFGEIKVLKTHERLFPELLQDVVILFADDYGSQTNTIDYQAFETVQDLLNRRPLISEQIDVAEVISGHRSFIQALLSRELRSLLDTFISSITVPAKELVSFNIGYVTGDKKFFHPSQIDIDKYEIPASSLRPSFASAKGMKSAGLYTASPENFKKDYLFLPDPNALTPGELQYIARGSEKGVAARYKCRIRDPWFLVPEIRTPDLVLSVFSERPLLMVNNASYLASNSLLCGYIQKGSIAQLITGWYTSLTLLQCELEVHALGGGVMVMIPGEAGNIRLPKTNCARNEHLTELDGLLQKNKINDAYQLGDSYVLIDQLKLSEYDIALIRQGIKTLKHWRTSARSSESSILDNSIP